ncbi:unnamed protein product [Sphenostylis stenocarpa]|uniref:Sugar phosphate transporter domain-containing protein n=1 Tax=Sphenostylis stenocarpa TaxID=92480 RepID=A0AA86S6M5_9FABA|nr:unnamed protein product [Sphenostylis stenocarpa]
MMSLVKYSAWPLSNPASSSHIPRPQLCTIPSIHNVQHNTKPFLSSLKPLHISSTENFALPAKLSRRVTECQAYEADRSRPLELNIELSGEQAGIEATQRLKIGLYFATWWALNVVFNIYNKKVLNAFPYPWLISTLSLAAGSLLMLISWATRVADVPKVNLEFWKALIPVAVAHTIGHVAATVSMSKVAVSFTHIIKSGEPAFSVLVSRFLLGEAFPVSVYLSLVPIIGGCALAAVTELNFNMIGFMGAMISNLAFVFRNIFSKKGMKGMSVSGMNYYACLSILSLLILTPFAIAVEGPKLWAAGWQTALSQIGPNFVWWVAAQSVFYHFYNQVSYMSLDQISPLTFSIGNTMKRISVIVSSILIFHTPIQPVNAIGAAIAILGTFLYSQILLYIYICFRGVCAFQEELVMEIILLLLICSLTPISQGLDRSPPFLFGTASSSYQYEGAYISDGKGLSNWDVFSHITGSISDGSNGDVAVDQYHRYLEDIDLMEAMKVNSYRFSISWARVLPHGRFGEVNLAGINYYNRLIDALLLKGIQPFVTLFHFDIPQELEDRYGGWLSPQSQEDFQFFADICFKSFGDRVKYWVTFNEPNYLVPLAYRGGRFPPCRCSSNFGDCSEGDSEKEPFVAAHNMILSHAAAVGIYRNKYQTEQGGKIGIALHCDSFEPLSNSTEDKLATERALSFNINWILDPILFGEYPKEMKMILGTNLPKFSSYEKAKLRRGLDFIGVNHYASYYVRDCISSTCEHGKGVSRTEGLYEQTALKNGVPIGDLTPFDWLNVYPQGMKKTLIYLKDTYNNTPMFITENGYGILYDPDVTEEEYLNDYKRIQYMSGHFENLMAAIREGADVRGYFAWSLLDNFEWKFGFSVRFGLHSVDHATKKRTPKLSATWYKNLIEKYTNDSIMSKQDRENRNWNKQFKAKANLRTLVNPQPRIEQDG